MTKQANPLCRWCKGTGTVDVFTGKAECLDCPPMPAEETEPHRPWGLFEMPFSAACALVQQDEREGRITMAEALALIDLLRIAKP